MELFSDDIEKFLQVGQYDQAIDALARRGGITPDEARQRLKDRLPDTTAVASGGAQAQDHPDGFLLRLKRKFVKGPVLMLAALWGK